MRHTLQMKKTTVCQKSIEKPKQIHWQLLVKVVFYNFKYSNFYEIRFFCFRSAMLRLHHLIVFKLLLVCALCKDFIIETKDDGKSAVKKPPSGPKEPPPLFPAKQPSKDPLMAMLEADSAPIKAHVAPLAPPKLAPKTLNPKKKKGKCKAKAKARAAGKINDFKPFV
jgi:hypothetical protein